jgi:hypothetical protein
MERSEPEATTGGPPRTRALLLSRAGVKQTFSQAGYTPSYLYLCLYKILQTPILAYLHTEIGVFHTHTSTSYR